MEMYTSVLDVCMDVNCLPQKIMSFSFQLLTTSFSFPVRSASVVTISMEVNTKCLAIGCNYS